MPASVLKNNFPHLARTLEAQLAAAQYATADDAIALMRDDMGKRKHGTQYPDLPNTSSAPGESPAVQDADGGLAADLHSVPVGNSDRTIVSTKRYARRLERGSIDGTTQPRPFMAPAIRRVLPRHLKRLNKVLVEAARGR